MNLKSLRDWVNLGFAAGVFSGTLGFFILTGPRGIAWLGGAEFQRRVALAEVGDGPWAKPLFVLLSQPFLLIPWDTIPRRASLAAAVFAAGACLFVYLLLKFLLKVAPQFIARRLGLVGALSLAVAHTFWLRAVTPGPETLDALLLAATLFCLCHFASEGRVRYLNAGVFVLGLSLANNLMMLFLVPIFIVYLRVVQPPLVRQIGMVRARALLVFLAGSAVALGITAWGWAAAGFHVPPERWSWVTFWREHMLLAWGPALQQSLLRLGVAFAYNFPPWTALFALMGFIQLARRQKFVFWLLAPLLVVYAVMTVTLTLNEPLSAYLPLWVIAAVLVGYGWWQTLADGGWRDYIIALVLTLSPPLLYHFAPWAVARLGLELRAQSLLRAPFELPLDPFVHLLDPNRRETPDARDYAQGVLGSLPAQARVVPASASGDRVLAPARYMREAEGMKPEVRFERFPVRGEDLERWAAEAHPPLFLAGLHPPAPAVEKLLDRYHFLPSSHLFHVLPRDRVPNRTLADAPGSFPLPGEWYGFARPQGYAVSLSIRDSPDGTLSGRAILNEGGARPLTGDITRLSLVGEGVVVAQISYGERIHVHLDAKLTENRVEGTWVVYEVPQLKGSFLVWRQSQ
jgi:hypothetical protein